MSEEGIDYHLRKWALEPKSQAAVDVMFRDPPMAEEIEIARRNGFIRGTEWIPPHKRGAPVKHDSQPAERKKVQGIDDF